MKQEGGFGRLLGNPWRRFTGGSALFKTCIKKREVKLNSFFASQSFKYISAPIFGHHHVLHLKHSLYNHRSLCKDSQYKNI